VTLMSIKQEKNQSNSNAYTDSHASHKVLDVSEFKYYRVNHSELFVGGHIHINEIENYWSRSRRQPGKFNGISRAHFHLFMKMRKWQFIDSDLKTQQQIMKQRLRRNMGWLSRAVRSCCTDHE
jgi:transposase